MVFPFVVGGGASVKKVFFGGKRVCIFHFSEKLPRGIGVRQQQKVALISSGAMDARDGFIILVVNGQVRMSGRMA